LSPRRGSRWCSRVYMSFDKHGGEHFDGQLPDIRRDVGQFTVANVDICSLTSDWTVNVRKMPVSSRFCRLVPKERKISMWWVCKPRKLRYRVGLGPRNRNTFRSVRRNKESRLIGFRGDRRLHFGHGCCGGRKREDALFGLHKVDTHRTPPPPLIGFQGYLGRFQRPLYQPDTEILSGPAALQIYSSAPVYLGGFCAVPGFKHKACASRILFPHSDGHSFWLIPTFCPSFLAYRRHEFTKQIWSK
jgi:hypothetical protein